MFKVLLRISDLYIKIRYSKEYQAMLEKNYSTELISREIRELLNSMDKFICNKDNFSENVKEMYLQVSTNN
jgi:hypothetical protein